MRLSELMAVLPTYTNSCTSHLPAKRPKSGPQPLGFHRARDRAVLSLSSDRTVAHEIRGSISEKNLLNTGEVSREFVAELLMRCLGTQYRSSRHHIQRDVEVYIFKPVIVMSGFREQWYIKLYFIDEVVFISVHRSSFDHD